MARPNKKKTTNKNTTNLRIVASQKKPLTKKQKAFNRLTKRIAKLEKQLVEDKDKYDLLLKTYLEKVEPLKVERAEKQIGFAMMLDHATERYKFSEQKLEDFGLVIVSMFDTAFHVVEPTEAQKAVYDKWNARSYDEELKEQMQGEKMHVLDMLKQMFDIELSEEEIEELENSPEAFAKLQERIMNNFEQQIEEEEKAESERPKSKREIEKENVRRAEELIKQKSIRNIYITLAKLLHPDTETDPVVRAEKEEVMKQVTKAYKEKDLATLLQLEMEWVRKTNAHLAELKSNELDIYMNALKEQVEQLEAELHFLRENPRYAPIYGLMDFSSITAKQEIQDEKESVEEQICEISHDTEELQKKGSKGAISEFVSFFSEMISQRAMMANILDDIVFDDMVFDDDFEDDDDFDYL